MPQKLSTDQANALSRHLDRLDLTSLKQLAKEKIPFITTLARNKIYKKTGKFEQIEEQDGVEIAKIRADRDEKDKKEVASKEKEVESLKNQVAMLKTKLENEKNRAIKPEPNPETGEVPLTIGIANKLLKDKAEKEAKKKEDMKEEMRLYVESIAAVKNKAEKTGMPYSILKQVYDRGMAAWKGGHRPGATQVQWALARVNSFVTKSSGTWGGADKDLAKKVKG
jgi:CRISPR/Cas system CSM-associated protein Csm2 small subunit